MGVTDTIARLRAAPEVSTAEPPLALDRIIRGDCVAAMRALPPPSEAVGLLIP